MKLKLVILLFNLVVSVFVAQGAITTTRQNLDEFSFKKGVKEGGGLSFSKALSIILCKWRARDSGLNHVLFAFATLPKTRAALVVRLSNV